MEQIKSDQLIITKKIMDEDPNFASFSDVSSTAESDNTLASKRTVVAIGEYWVDWVDHRVTLTPYLYHIYCYQVTER